MGRGRDIFPDGVFKSRAALFRNMRDAFPACRPLRDQRKEDVTMPKTKNSLSAPFCAEKIPGLSAPLSVPSWLALSDCEFLRDECGEDFLRDFIGTGFHFADALAPDEMYIGQDNALYSKSFLLRDYNAAREDESTSAWLDDEEIESFDDFMDYQTAMSGFLVKLPVYYGYSVNGYDTGEYAEDIETIFDKAELALMRNTDAAFRGDYRINIVRYWDDAAGFLKACDARKRK